MTAVGYGSEAHEDIAKFERYWPADLHLVGKEIIRFHCVYWPAFLMAMRPAGEDEAAWNRKWLPKSVVANGWLLFEESKMSKSRGNVVRAETILDAFGSLKPDLPKAEQDLFATDVLRYFLLREIPFGQDGSFSFDALVQRYNSDLANGYGNLVSRVFSMIEQSFEGSIPAHYLHIDLPERPDRFELNADAMELANDVKSYQSNPYLNTLFEFFDFDLYLQEIFKFVAKLDGFLTRTTPWKLAKSSDETDRTNLGTILFISAQCIRVITRLLYPFIPYAAAQVWSQLGLGSIKAVVRDGEPKDLVWGGLEPGTKLGSRSNLFPSIKKEEIPRFIQTMIDTEERNAQEAAAAKSKPAEPATNPGAQRLDSEKWVSTAPDSPPRTSSLPTENPGAHVAASAAITTERPGTPPHHEAPASAPFANAAAASAIPDTPQIAIDDFVKIDLRVAKILVAERIPKADKLLRLEVDLGYEKRQILSGIAEWYTPEELVGRTIVVIANLAPRKMRGLESHGMLLAASHGENGKPVLATFGEEIALGSRLR
jgi:methionyl-tRNA synthetase